MTPGEFAAKWRDVETSERASAQSHFLDLCAMLAEPGPTQADPTGTWYAFEKGAEKLGGGDGFADVWKRGRFGWEYKGKGKDLKAAETSRPEPLHRHAGDLQVPALRVAADRRARRSRANRVHAR